MIPFNIKISYQDSLPVIKITGELDIHNCKELDTVLNPLLAQDHSLLAFNLEDTAYIDSTGLGVIANAARQLAKTQGNIWVICPKSQLKKVFELAGLHKKNIVLFEDEKTALSRAR